MTAQAIPSLRCIVWPLVLALALVLQGCKESYCPYGEKMNQPLVAFKPDYEKLDRAAGCNNNWSPISGKPCASDVPLLFAKKGIYEQDQKWIRRSLENEETQCMTNENATGFCTKWFSETRTCWRDELQICWCTNSPSQQTGGTCSEWRCLMKEIHHRTCWEANWDTSFHTTCALHGINRIHLNYSALEDLWGTESSATFGSQEFIQDIIKNQGAGRARTMNWQTMNTSVSMDQQHNECIVPWPVARDATRKPSGCPGNHWRTIISKIFNCECTTADCASWKCLAQKDTLPPKKYFDSREYKCLQRDFARNNTCVWWSGEIRSFPISAILECRDCADTVNAKCRQNVTPAITHACTMYPMDRIYEFDQGDADGGVWIARFGFWILHSMWISMGLMCMAVTVGSCMDVGELCTCEGCINTTMCSVCLLAGGTFMWVIAFVRSKNDNEFLPRQESNAPTLPYIGILTTVYFAGICLCCLVYTTSTDSQHNEDTVVAGSCLAVAVMLAIGLTYTCGLIIGLCFILPIIGIFFLLVAKAYQRYQTYQAEQEDEEESDEPE